MAKQSTSNSSPAFKLQRFFFNILALVFLIAPLAVIVQNLSVYTSFQVLTYQITDLSLGVLLLATGGCLALGISFRFWDSLIHKQLRQMQASRKLERLEVTAESSEERVKALEQKIQTLEAALKNALNQPQTNQNA